MVCALLISMLGCPAPPVVVPDADRDGFDASIDCDDGDADAFPGAVEFCDGRDNDCNGEIDDEAVDGRDFFIDEDDDGFGVDAVFACSPPSGTAPVGGDCDDTDGEVRPGRTELCNGVDDDCDGTIDVEPDTPFWFDADSDGFGDPNAPLHTCTPPPAYVANRADCDDTTAAVNPDADEVCNGVDDDCDQAIDDADVDRIDPPEWFPDADGDGFGVPGFTVEACEPPAGPWSLSDADCDAFDPDRFPGAIEICDGVDDDCDGVVDGPSSVPSRGVSVPLELEAVRATGRPVFAGRIDLQQAFEDAGGVGDVDEVVFAQGSCATGIVWHPTRFVDAWSEFGVPGTGGDGDGVLVVAGPEGSGTLTGSLYFDQPALGDASASASELSSGGSSVQLDGPRLDGSNALVSQIAFGPRVETTLGSIEFASASQIAVDDHPGLSRVVASGTAANGAGALDWEIEWWKVSGGEETYVGIRASTTQPTDVFHPVESGSAVIPFAVETTGTLSTTDGDWRIDESGESLVIRNTLGPGNWVPGPTWLEFRGTDGADSGPLWAAPAGTVLMDHRFAIGSTSTALDDAEPMPLGLAP